jgi:hypothetical protein
MTGLKINKKRSQSILLLERASGQRGAVISFWHEKNKCPIPYNAVTAGVREIFAMQRAVALPIETSQ